MKIEISRSERNTLLHWAEESKSKAGHYGDGDAAFPDEVQLVDMLESHPGGPLELGLNKIMIILAWAESVIQRHFGRGVIANPIEEAILAKAQKAYKVLSMDRKEEVEEPAESGKAGGGQAVSKSGVNVIRWVVIACALGVLLVLILGVFHHQNKMGHKPIADGGEYRVRFVTGQVYYKREGPWKRVGSNARLLPGDSIKTGNESSVTVANDHGDRKISDKALTVLK